MRIKIMMFAAILFLLNTTLIAGVPIVVKGIVTDEYTGKPASVEIIFKNGDGTKIKIQSNSITGKFEQVLNSGTEYEVILQNYDIIRKETSLAIEESDSYMEKKVEFTVKKLKPGRVVFDYDLFASNSTELSDAGKLKLKELKSVMRFNRSVKFEFKVSGRDSGSSSKTLTDGRIQAIKDYIDKWRRAKRRITFVADYSASGSGEKGTEVIVTVKSIEDVFK